MWNWNSINTVILLFGAIAAVVQQKPDFSGEWVLNRAASTLSPAAAAMESGVVRIEHREPLFRYKAAFVGGGQPIDYAYELQTDGLEVAGGGQGRTFVSSLRWDGSTLEFASKIQRADGEMTIVFRYELLDDGRRLRAMERLRGGGRDQDNIWIFDRR